MKLLIQAYTINPDYAANLQMKLQAAGNVAIGSAVFDIAGHAGALTMWPGHTPPMHPHHHIQGTSA
ncbi:hypothetical protein [Acidovorax sp. RAC01]|uniref:hypothetical protein n=1 Tax=Acidovorax sp. RAC01 TaxID=1842533 RepID=UPI00083E7404|nr:hypothetical protein [Acidovorax sp. RAC01]